MKPTQEQVIAWARDAGITFQTHQGISGRLRTLTEGSQSIKRIETIATLAYEAGRKDENDEIAAEFEKRHEAVKHRNNYFLHAANYVRARREQ